ncbi:MAG: hypothetical protein LW688_04225 [Cryomorphaceae bacterium]|jgi:seryl-tRNA synthetase|nr:hypothetical protein [Cryomorphaceae bacterium]
MKIHNDFRSLDQEIKFLQQELEQLAKYREQLATKIEQLYKDGFKDKKFEELKTAVEKSSKTLLDVKKSIDQSVIDLQTRSEIIKQYYAVTL